MSNDEFLELLKTLETDFWNLKIASYVAFALVALDVLLTLDTDTAAGADTCPACGGPRTRPTDVDRVE